eukprot:284816989_6
MAELQGRRLPKLNNLRRKMEVRQRGRMMRRRILLPQYRVSAGETFSFHMAWIRYLITIWEMFRSSTCVLFCLSASTRPCCKRNRNLDTSGLSCPYLSAVFFCHACLCLSSMCKYYLVGIRYGRWMAALPKEALIKKPPDEKREKSQVETQKRKARYQNVCTSLPYPLVLLYRMHACMHADGGNGEALFVASTTTFFCTRNSHRGSASIRPTGATTPSELLELLLPNRLETLMKKTYFHFIFQMSQIFAFMTLPMQKIKLEISGSDSVLCPHETSIFLPLPYCCFQQLFALTIIFRFHPSFQRDYVVHNTEQKYKEAHLARPPAIFWGRSHWVPPTGSNRRFSLCYASGFSFVVRFMSFFGIKYAGCAFFRRCCSRSYACFGHRSFPSARGNWRSRGYSWRPAGAYYSWCPSGRARKSSRWQRRSARWAFYDMRCCCLCDDPGLRQRGFRTSGEARHSRSARWSCWPCCYGARGKNSSGCLLLLLLYCCQFCHRFLLFLLVDDIILFHHHLYSICENNGNQTYCLREVRSKTHTPLIVLYVDSQRQSRIPDISRESRGVISAETRHRKNWEGFNVQIAHVMSSFSPLEFCKLLVLAFFIQIGSSCLLLPKLLIHFSHVRLEHPCFLLQSQLRYMPAEDFLEELPLALKARQIRKRHCLMQTKCVSFPSLVSRASLSHLVHIDCLIIWHIGVEREQTISHFVVLRDSFIRFILKGFVIHCTLYQPRTITMLVLRVA